MYERVWNPDIGPRSSLSYHRSSSLGRWSDDTMVMVRCCIDQGRDGTCMTVRWYDSAMAMVRLHDDDDAMVMARWCDDDDAIALWQ